MYNKIEKNTSKRYKQFFYCIKSTLYSSAMITIGTCTNGTSSGMPSDGVQDENVVKNLVKKITFMVVAKLIPGH